MAHARVDRARGAVVAVALLILSVHLAEAATQNAPRSCRARLEQAYAAGKLPAKLSSLCEPARRAQGAWLDEIALGTEVDIVRYWDLLQIADDLDRTAMNVPLVSTLLPGILAETAVDALTPPSWLERLKAWLHELLTEHDEVDLAWLEDWLRTLDRHRDGFGIVVRVSVVLMLVGALYVVLREIELSGGWAWPRLRKLRRAVRERDADTRTPTPFKWSDILTLPAAARPPAMLRWLVSELSARQLLPPDDSLTNREQLALLAAGHPRLHAPFASVLNAIEPYVYGEHLPPPEDELAARVRAVRDVADKT